MELKRLILKVTIAHKCTVFWSQMKSLTYVYLPSLKSILISSPMCLVLQSGLLHLDSLTQVLYVALPSRALHVSFPLNFNFVASVMFYEGWNLCISSLHSFLHLRISLCNVLQASCKVCCVVRFFESYGNCLAVHLCRLVSWASGLLWKERESECDDVRVNVGNNSAWAFMLQRRHEFGSSVPASDG